MKQLIECVPNFSEGVNADIIAQIARAISSTPGLALLNVDPGQAANRTVITFAGEPQAVVDAAYKAIKMAGELIDMRKQKGEHPRMGGTDVCPLIPIANITMEETDRFAKQLAQRVGEDLQIPVYLYEQSQADKRRSNLSIIRSGEYEGFFEKIKQPGWVPDYGPAELDAKRGATVIGARNLLVAYNVNLDTDSVALANSIAYDVRESGRMVTKTEDGIRVKQRIPGALKSVKAIGWYIKEYGKAQVSMNLTDINVTPIHEGFVAVIEAAATHGAKVTGSELIGMIPLKAMLDAGQFFCEQQGLSATSDNQLIAMAVAGMGLDELAPFHPRERIIEYRLEDVLNGSLLA